MNYKEEAVNNILNESSASVLQEKQKVKDYVIKYMVVYLYFINNKKMKEIAEIYDLKVKDVSKIIEEYREKYLNKNEI